MAQSIVAGMVGEVLQPVTVEVVVGEAKSASKRRKAAENSNKGSQSLGGRGHLGEAGTKAMAVKYFIIDKDLKESLARRGQKEVED